MMMTMLRKHNEIVRNCIQVNNGSEIKHTGDGIMAAYMSSSKAVRSALDMQKAFSSYRQMQTNPEIPLHVRICINAGEPVTEGHDFFGVAVQLSKHLCDLADPDQVLISEVVKGLCMGRNFHFSELGAHHVKGISQQVKIFIALGYS